MWASPSRDSRMDLERLYPKGLKLEQVQVILRHGERSPIRPLFRHWHGLDTEWRLCNSAHHLTAVIMTGSGNWDRITWRRRLETFGKNDQPLAESFERAGVWQVFRQNGELTDKGRLTSLQFGQRLRDLYVYQLGFLPKFLDNPDTVYVRTSSVDRTLESVHQALAGLYPPGTTVEGRGLPIIHVRAPKDDNLRVNCAECPRLKEIMSAFVKRTGERWNHSPEMDYINSRLAKHLPPGGQPLKIEPGPRLGTVMDNIRASLAHQPHIKLPPEFLDPELRRLADPITLEEWFAGFNESNECRMLGIGSLAGDIAANMTKMAEERNMGGSGSSRSIGGTTTGSVGRAMKFALFGGHHSTIGAMLISLGCFDGEGWPPFTSHIDLELFRDATVPRSRPNAIFRAFGVREIGRRQLRELSGEEQGRLDGYYVRVKYNDRVMRVPACSGNGSHLPGDKSFCTLATFKSIVDEFTPKDWSDACASNLGEPILQIQEKQKEN